MRFIILGVVIAMNYNVGCDCAGKPGPAPVCDRPGLPSCASLDAGDAAAGDAQVIDAAVVDAGVADSGVVDAGALDAGSGDGGAIDSGTTDAGVTDAGVTDAGMTDAGAQLTPATSLTWLELSPSAVATVTAAWTRSTTPDVTGQSVQFFGDATCTNPTGAVMPLGPTVQMLANTFTRNGVFSYQVTTTNPSGSVASACSNAMTVTVASTINISPASHDFGNVVNGYAPSASFSFTFTNTGTVAATGCTAPGVTGSGAASFEITFTNCTASLAAGASCAVNVRALATGTGAVAATIERTCQVNGFAMNPKAQLQAAWVNAASHLVMSSERDGNFGTATLNRFTSTKDVIVGNTGLATAVGCTAPVVGDLVNFSIVSTDCTAQVAAGQHCTIKVRGRPSTAGLKNSQLTFDCGAESVNLPLQVRGDNATVPTGIAIGNPSVFLMSDGKVRISQWVDVYPEIMTGFTNATNVTAGNAYFCGLRANQTIGCWGDNNFGDFGDGTNTDTYGTASTVSGITTATAVAANPEGFHTCAIVGAGTVMCWGQNTYGQLGNNSTADSLIPVSTGITNATAISVGVAHSCAVITGGTVRCWGNNDSGELGDGTTLRRLQPVNVKTSAGTNLTGVRAIAAGNFDNTCAILTGNTVRCWGSDTYGKIGDGLSTDRLYASNGPALSNVSQLTVGYVSVCALLLDGTVKCWGTNGAGELGTGDSIDSAVPVTVVGVTGVSSLSSHWRTNCALKTTGEVQCWGLDEHGVKGTGESGYVSIARKKSGISTATQLAAGVETVCALLGDQTVRCWGNWNTNNQLGTGNFVSVSNPAPLPGVTGAIAVAASDHSNCALLGTGTIQCVGLNDSGQLGNGMTGAFGALSTVLGITTATQFSAGQEYFCARLADGTVKCWGNNQSGQLGNGGSGFATTPVTVTGLSGVLAVYSSAGQHTCAVLSSRDVVCWGLNANGQLGDGSIINRTAPTPVTGLHNVKSLALGLAHTCAVLMDGTGLCWGANDEGQLGDGTTTEQHVPVNVGWFADFESLSAGPRMTCGLLRNGTARCWGNNDEGALGNGSLAPLSSVADSSVFSLSNITQLTSSANDYNINSNVNCALHTDQTVSCWGGAGVGLPSLTVTSSSGFIP